jgi:hypothetical protein
VAPIARRANVIWFAICRGRDARRRCALDEMPFLRTVLRMQLTGFHHLTAVTAEAARNHEFYTPIIFFTRMAARRRARTSPSLTGPWAASGAARAALYAPD